MVCGLLLIQGAFSLKERNPQIQYQMAHNYVRAVWVNPIQIHSLQRSEVQAPPTKISTKISALPVGQVCEQHNPLLSIHGDFFLHKSHPNLTGDRETSF